jgi:hypothetical protein
MVRPDFSEGISQRKITLGFLKKKEGWRLVNVVKFNVEMRGKVVFRSGFVLGASGKLPKNSRMYGKEKTSEK